MRGTQPWRVNRARVLRSNATSAEDKLWLCLRDRRLGGFKFVRQFPIDGYYVDFACRKGHLIIEVDGGTHSSPVEVANDAKRAETLAALGYKIVRISNAEIYEKIEGVRDRLLALLEQRDV